MILYEDRRPHSSRMIWVNYREEDNTVSFELQDLGDDFEYERCMSGISLDEMLKALHLSDLDSLFAFLRDNYSAVDAMDRINEEILSKHGIDFVYYSC